MVRSTIMLITNWCLAVLVLVPLWNLFIVHLGVAAITIPAAFGLCMFLDYFVKDIKLVTVEGDMKWKQFFKWYFKYSGLALFGVFVTWIIIALVYVVLFGFDPVWFGSMRIM